MKMIQQHRARPIFGIIAGMILAAVLSVWALIGYTMYGDDVISTPGLSLDGLLILYLVGGAIGGLMFGLLLPITTRRSGAVVVGVVALAPFFLLKALIGSWTAGSMATRLVAASVVTVVLGTILALVVWKWEYGSGGEEEPPATKASAA